MKELNCNVTDNASLDRIDCDSTYQSAYSILLETQMNFCIKEEGFPDANGWAPKFDILVDTNGHHIRMLDEKSADWFKSYLKREALKEGE